MTQHNPWQALIEYYETSHQTNEATILERLQRQGVSLDTLTEDVLQDYDMDHYGGVEAVELLAQKAGLGASYEWIQGLRLWLRL